eukprot:TCONS_00053942-protein
MATAHIKNDLEATLDDLFILDEKASKIFQNINHRWVYNKLDRFKLHPELGEKFRVFLDEQLSVSGSIEERASICRWFIKKGPQDPIITMELDSMYCVGEIPSLDTCPDVEIIQEHLGFYKMKQSTINSCYEMAYDPQILEAFASTETYNPRRVMVGGHGGSDEPPSTSESNRKKMLSLLEELKSDANCYLRVDIMTEILGLMIVDGKQDAENTKREGPSLECEMHLNYTLNMTLGEMAEKCGWPIKEYWFPASALDDLSNGTEEPPRMKRCVDNIGDLIYRAFPDNSSTPDVTAMSKILQMFLEKADCISSLIPLIIEIAGVISKRNFMPFICFNEFGPLFFDNVPSLKVQQWPGIADKFLSRTGKFWPMQNMVDLIVANGCHIVPKSFEGGDKKADWRISFSAAELELTKIQTEKHRKCYLVAKCIYYARIKSSVTDQDKSLPSYFLKTTWFNLLEQHPVSWFEDRTIFDIIGELYGELAVCFGTGYMENIFISKMNILREVDRSKLEEAEIMCRAIAVDPSAYLPDDLIHVMKVGKSALKFGEYMLEFMEKTDLKMLDGIYKLIHPPINNSVEKVTSKPAMVGIVYDSDSDLD